MKNEKLKVKRAVIWRLFRSFPRYSIFFFSLFTIHFSLFTAASAQETAPPPVKTISKEARARLENQPDAKARIKLASEMMKRHLDAAEKLHSADDHEAVFVELGALHYLVDDIMAYLNRRNIGSDKILDNYKRFEITVRALIPRVEAIRRDLPFSREEYVRSLVKHLRSIRIKALDAMMG